MAERRFAEVSGKGVRAKKTKSSSEDAAPADSLSCQLWHRQHMVPLPSVSRRRFFCRESFTTSVFLGVRIKIVYTIGETT